jgi:hypothetical protein
MLGSFHSTRSAWLSLAYPWVSLRHASEPAERLVNGLSLVDQVWSTGRHHVVHYYWYCKSVLDKASQDIWVVIRHDRRHCCFRIDDEP